MTSRPLDADLLRSAFVRLETGLARRSVIADVALFGGAAMLLAYDAKRFTRDADAVFVPDQPVLDAAAEVAASLGLPTGWLNQQASSYLPREAWVDRKAVFNRPVYDGPHLRVAAMAPEHLLAMKVLASRPGDVDDIALLVRRLGLTARDAVEEVVARVYPGEPLPDRAGPVIEDALALAAES